MDQQTMELVSVLADVAGRLTHVELLGSRCVLSGVSPSLTRRMAGELLQLRHIESYGTLKQALAARIGSAVRIGATR